MTKKDEGSGIRDEKKKNYWIWLSSFIPHPYLVTPRLEDRINSTSCSTSTESLISSMAASWRTLACRRGGRRSAGPTTSPLPLFWRGD